jgi:protein TonB
MNATSIPGSDFLDILFQGRNKDYGAYALRRKYDQRLRNAIAGTAAIALTIIGLYMTGNKLMTSSTDIRNRPVVNETRLMQLQPEIKPPPPPFIPPVQPPPVKASVRVTTLVITRDQDVAPEDEPPRVKDIGVSAIGTVTAAGADEGIAPDLLTENSGSGVVQPPAPEDRETVRTSVEIMPSFPGGDAALARFLQENIRYPALAAENGISGTVMVQFVVDYEGNIKDVRIAGSARGGGLENEALRVVKLMPKWKPGRQNGQAVSVQFNLPVSFRLE